MKKLTKTLLGVIILFCFTGCGGRTEEIISPWANIGAIAETDESWLYFHGNQLYLLSKEKNGKPEPWCIEEGCDHTGFTGCPSLLYHKYPNTLAVDEKYAYIAGLEEGQLYLYRMSMEGKAGSLERWKALADVSDSYCGVETIEIGGNWYYLLGTAGEDQKFSWSLGKVELKDGSQKTIYTAEEGESLENLKVQKGKIYVSSWIGEESRILCMDEKGNKEEVLSEAVYSYVIKEDQLYYSGETPGIWKKDLKTGEVKCWIEREENWLGISWDGKYWYADNFNAVRLSPGEEYDEEKARLANRSVFVYDEEGKQVDEIHADSISGECLFGGPEALVLATGEGGTITYMLFDKSQIGKERDNNSKESILRQYKSMSK